MATENKMGVMPLNRLLISMSVPMMISMLVQALYNIVDSMFVAQLSENALTAVSLAFPAQNLMIAVATGTLSLIHILEQDRITCIFPSEHVSEDHKDADISHEHVIPDRLSCLI